MSDLKLSCFACKQAAVLHTDEAFTTDGGMNGYEMIWYCSECNIDVRIRADEEEECIKKTQAFFNEKMFQTTAVPPPVQAVRGTSIYSSLENVLAMALDQASPGKGKERHAEDAEPFEKQQICEITRRVGQGFPLGQAVKKIQESPRLVSEHRINELLGAINYIAASIIVEMGEKK